MKKTLILNEVKMSFTINKNIKMEKADPELYKELSWIKVGVGATLKIPPDRKVLIHEELDDYTVICFWLDEDGYPHFAELKKWALKK